MAQAGYTPILIYASGTATNIPTSGNLISGSSGAELAINYADGKLYYKDGSGNVKLLSIGYGSSSVTPTNGGVQYGTGTALALTAAGSSGQILRSNGAAAPTWADLSTLGVNTISFGTTGLTPNSATAGAVTVAGTLVTANGGTGLGGATPFTANGVLYASSASALTSGSALTFDGTTFTYGAGGSATTNTAFTLNGTDNAAYGTGVLGKRNGTNTWFIGDTAWALGSGTGVINYNYGTAPWIWYLQTGGEQMRLTSTGLKSSIAGTNADPVFSYTSDTNTGIFFPAADKLGFTAGGGTDQMVLTTTGLGIGTSSPGQKLQVVGAVASTGQASALTASSVFLDYIVGTDKARFAVVGNATGTTGQIIFSQYSSNGSVGRDALTLDSSGNLGLGVTPSAWAAGTYKGLEVSVGNAASVNLVGGDASLMSNAYISAIGTSRYLYSSVGATKYQFYNGIHAWYTAPSGTAGNAITFTQSMTLDASGNLGVGDTSPNARVSIRLDGTGAYAEALWKNTNSTAQLAIGVAGSAVGVAAIQNNAYLYNTGNSAMVFGTNNTERARITSGGYFKASDTGTYLGIADSSHELRNSSDNGTVIATTNASQTANSLQVESTRNTTNNTFYAISYYNRGSAAYKFRVADSGDVTNTNGSYGTISDAKMKTDIVDASSQWADIKAIRFRKFKMKNDPSGLLQLGVIAQELEQTSPGLVDEHVDRDAEGNDLGTTTKSVKTSILLMKAAKALQEAMARIETLEAKVSALEGN